MTTMTAASWNMDTQFPASNEWNTALVGMQGNEGFTVQPFTPVATGLPSRLRIAGGNAWWSMIVDFEIWCASQCVVKKTVDTSGLDQYSQGGTVYNLSFDDVVSRESIQAGKPCEVRIQTIQSSITNTSFGVCLVWKNVNPGTLGNFGNVYLPGYGGEQNLACLIMDLAVV